MKRGETYRFITDWFQSCCSVDVTWAPGWRQEPPRETIPSADPDHEPETCVSRSPTTSHSKCACHFFFLVPRLRCTWTPCAFSPLARRPIWSFSGSSVSWSAAIRRTVTRIINRCSTRWLQPSWGFIQFSADQRRREACSQIIWREALEWRSLKLLRWSVVLRTVKNCRRNASFAVTDAFIRPFAIHNIKRKKKEEEGRSLGDLILTEILLVFHQDTEYSCTGLTEHRLATGHQASSG